MVPTYQIHHREHRRTSGHGVKGVDVGNGIPVVLRGSVKTTVIAARTPTTIGLRHNVEGRSPRRRRTPNDAHGEHLLELGFGDGELLASKRTSTSIDWRSNSGDHMFHPVQRRRGVILGDEDIREVVEQRLDLVGARIVKTKNCCAASPDSSRGNHNERGLKARETNKLPSLDINEKTGSGKEVGAQNGLPHVSDAKGMKHRNGIKLHFNGFKSKCLYH